ncbi:TetR-like C-terminal domain-containing protein [Luteococcus peritonei]|uniref:TetR-like C-terminal domain-containing protein n=1 Tax=Luteococcus peritonei TaxID=88874 RepID=A0ABW4RTQ7_9ACTN
MPTSDERTGRVHAALLHHLATRGWEGLDVATIAEQVGCRPDEVLGGDGRLADLVVDALVAASEHSPALREPPGTSLREDVIFLLSGQAADLETDAGRALRPVMASRPRDPELVERALSAVMVPRQQLWVQVVADAVARGEARPRAMDPLVLSVGPRMLVAEDLDGGPVTTARIEELTDLVVLPLLTR